MSDLIIGASIMLLGILSGFGMGRATTRPIIEKKED